MFLLGVIQAPGVVYSVGAVSAHDSRFSPTNSAAEIAVKQNGTIVGEGNQSATSTNWITPRDSTSGDDFEVEFHVNSGSTPTGAAMDTWLALTSDQTIALAQTVAGSKECVVRVRIRQTSDSVVVAEGTATMSVNKEP